MAPKTPGMVVAFRADRLGARLISLVNAIRLANKFGVEHRMHWLETSGVGIEFNDINTLFDAGFTKNLLMEREEWLNFRRHARNIGELSNKSSAELSAWLSDGNDIRVEMAFGLVCLADEDPDEVAATSRQIFLALPLAAPLVALTEVVRHALQNSVAYHMRRGDLVSNIKAMNKSWPHKVVPEAYYHAHMTQALKRKHDVVVFSDEPDMLARAKDVFPEMKTMADIVSLDDILPSARDFLELYAMSSCMKIIAPEASAFSATAASLGGTQRHDVKADLPPDLRDACSEDLHQTLLTAPETLGEVGLIGQTLPHVRDYLIDAGRLHAAIALYEGFIARRMPISFLYPQYMEMLLDAAQYDKLLDLAADIADLPILDTRSLHRCIAFTLQAHTGKKQADACKSTLVSLFAQFPLAGELKKILPTLLYTGALAPDAFLPYSPEIVFGYGRRLGLAGQSSSNNELFNLLAPDIAPDLPKNTVGSLEPLWWDWAPILPGNVVAVSERKGLLNDVFDDLSKARFDDLSPDAASTLALLTAYKGDLRPALDLLKNLGSKEANSALIQHRISLVYRLMRNWKAATSHAVAAAELSDLVAHQAWAGLLLIRDRKAEKLAYDHLCKAAAAGFPFPDVALGMANLEYRSGRTDAAFAALQVAQKQSPSDVRPEIARAEFHLELGSPEAARNIYAKLHHAAKLPMKCYPALVEIYIAEGDLQSARDVIDHVLAHKPDNPALIKLRATLS